MIRQLKWICTPAILFMTGLMYAQGTVEFIEENFPGQEMELREALGDLQDGDYYYQYGRGNIEVALDFYRQADHFNPNNAELKFKIGKCYLETKPISEAIRYFKWALRIDSTVNKDVYYHLGQAYHMDMSFNTAVYYYKQYKYMLNPEEAQEKNAELIKRIEQAYYGQELFNKPARVHIENLGAAVNSPYPDYHPIINADASVLFFTSRRESTTGSDKDVDDLMYFEDIFLSIDSNGTWTPARSIGPPINTRSHESVMGISPDGQSLLLYSAKGGGDIYESHLVGEEWTKPRSLGGEINTRHQESSASYSYDGREIFVISDRPGGYGGNDIWVCRRDLNGNWGEAQNLGRAVNSSDDEVSVFMHPDGKTLYYSSRGHQSMGGLDVFKTVRDITTLQWSQPENLGYPINTPDDDVFFSISASGRYAYYSTNRPDGFGSHDLYKISFFGPEKYPTQSTEDNLIASRSVAVTESHVADPVEIESMQLTLLKGQVRDAFSKQPLGATIELVDNSRAEVIAVFNSNSASGKYLVTLPAGRNYGIAVQAEGYLFHSENFNISDTAVFNEVMLNINLQKIEIGSEIRLNNIFFDYKKSQLNAESRLELNRIAELMQRYPAMRIEISGHTDNIGSAEYNKELSEQRAKAVVDFLAQKGIATTRLQYKGYGFEKPVADNTTEEGRKLNRRSEFKIIEN